MRMPCLLVGLVALVGCGTGKDAAGARDTVAKDTLSTRDRQEALGNSGLAGAKGINRALQIVDTAAERASALDTLDR